MKTIWKFQIIPENSLKNLVELSIPKGAEILAIQTQFNEPVLWTLVDTEAEKETRYFEIFGTGHEIKSDMGVYRKYIGTFQLDNGSLVFHLFECIN